MEKLWKYSISHKSPCKVIEDKKLWGQDVCRIWLLNQNSIEQVPCSSLVPINSGIELHSEVNHIAYISAAAKIADFLGGSKRHQNEAVLLAPMESNVIPLPHQLHTLSRVISGDQIRYLLADEVGLGKTIEAGLIMRELKLRGLVRRVLIVVPKGLTTQWVSEMKIHFNEEFQLILNDDIGTLTRLVPNGRGLLNSGYFRTQASTLSSQNNDIKNNIWELFDQVIVSIDLVKPLQKRQKWSSAKIEDYNKTRYEDLITSGWDLIIFDEAHRLGGSTEQVARYQLGKGLSDAAPYVLMLSATPHQGKTDSFYRLMNIIDNESFPDEESISKERILPYVIRTEKRNAIDMKGDHLFKKRSTQLVPIVWKKHHYLQRKLYEQVTEYVHHGYNQALSENKQYIGFLMILMQRLVVSSTHAIRTTLERRLNVLKGISNNQSQTRNELDLQNIQVNLQISQEDWEDMNGQEQLEVLQGLLITHHKEIQDVQELLDLAIQCEQIGPDAKAEFLLELIYYLQSEENEPDLKVLIFTEFIPTQEMLKAFFEERGLSVVTLNGTMDMLEREHAQDAFKNTHRIMVSTDAGGEGLNLQFAHVVINYDIPWNPMKLEQRIGRLDRIGQTRNVRAFNFVFEDSVEFRVREVLEEKLSVILNDFGIDKTGDVLDSSLAGEMFDEIFASAIVNPEDLESYIDKTLSQLRDEINQIYKKPSIYGISEELNSHITEHLQMHPLPHWIERMTINYIQAFGGNITRRRSWWDLLWPNGQESKKSVFYPREIDKVKDSILLNLQSERIRNLVNHMYQVVEGQLVPCVSINELPPHIEGLWGLYEINLLSGIMNRVRHLRVPPLRSGYICVFINQEGKVFMPTARHIWDSLLTNDANLHHYLGQEESYAAYRKLSKTVEEYGRDLFISLEQLHHDSLKREEERARIFFQSREKAIKKIGLPEVRDYRLAQLKGEKKEWEKEFSLVCEMIPEIRPLKILSIISGEKNE